MCRLSHRIIIVVIIVHYLAAANSLLVVEAKQADLTHGFVQLAAELIALNLWISRRRGVQSLSSPLFGAVTTGEIWRFGRYNPLIQEVTQDLKLYQMPEDLDLLSRILKGILSPSSP